MSWIAASQQHKVDNETYKINLELFLSEYWSNAPFGNNIFIECMHLPTSSTLWNRFFFSETLSQNS